MPRKSRSNTPSKDDDNNDNEDNKQNYDNDEEMTDSSGGGDDPQQEEEEEEEDEDSFASREPNVTTTVLCLWFIIAGLFGYEMYAQSSSMIPLLKEEDSCCGDPIDIGIIPTMFFYITVATMGSAIILIFMGAAATEFPQYKRSCLMVPSLHFCFTITPLLEAIMYWSLLYTQSSKNQAFRGMLVKAIRVAFQLVSISLTLRHDKKMHIRGVVCHAVLQLHGIVAIIAIYILYVTNGGGLCYVASGEDGSGGGWNTPTFGGCEICPSTGLPPINGACINANSPILLDDNMSMNNLPSGSYCGAYTTTMTTAGAEALEQNFCYFQS